VVDVQSVCTDGVTVTATSASACRAMLPSPARARRSHASEWRTKTEKGRRTGERLFIVLIL
jgi:hypothetical protein